MFDSVIIIVINGYEYHSIVSIHLSPHAHLDKNKVSVQTLQKPATEAQTWIHFLLGFAAR